MDGCERGELVVALEAAGACKGALDWISTLPTNTTAREAWALSLKHAHGPWLVWAAVLFGGERKRAADVVAPSMRNAVACYASDALEIIGLDHHVNALRTVPVGAPTEAWDQVVLRALEAVRALRLTEVGGSTNRLELDSGEGPLGLGTPLLWAFRTLHAASDAVMWQGRVDRAIAEDDDFDLTREVQSLVEAAGRAASLSLRTRLVAEGEACRFKTWASQAMEGNYAAVEEFRLVANRCRETFGYAPAWLDSVVPASAGPRL